ncbi:MAG: TIGR02302 family protein [Proteobacteria bacterium]|nr:TIGR02302 family protein [Pseudomonadota bacterium]
MSRGAAAGFKAVDEKIARHRLEQDSGLEHRPLTALHDRLATGEADPDAQSLWRVHLGRMAAAAARLRLDLPSPGLAKRDPYGLRVVVVLFLVIAAAASGADAVARLERALVPRMDATLGGTLELDVWITPPAYTGLAPLFMEPAREVASAGDGLPAPEPVRVPVGSTLLSQATGAAAAPQLIVGGRKIQFAAISDAGAAAETGSYRVETILEDADRGADALEIHIGGRVLARWPLNVVADVPPEVEFTRAPARAGRAQLRIEYEARDDYGLAGLQVVIRHPDGRSVPGGRPAIRAELPLPGLSSNRVEGKSLQDFSAHPWAGLPVLVQLQAIDARGQAGQSDIITIILPERVFNHPVARAIAEARKKLSTPDDDVVAEVVEALNDIASRPQHFFDDTIVFLALSVAASRLIHDGTDVGIGTVQALLWETALRIEDGEFALAERDLKDIQDRLMRAFRDGKDSAEIERLLDELSLALDKYMAALAEHLAKQGLAQLPAIPSSRFLDSTDLQRMIEEARELARTGSLESAKRMLSELRRMLDGIRNGLQRGQSRQDMAKARQMMDGLRKLTDRQRRELDKTFKRHQQSQGALRARPEPGGRQKGQRQGKGQGDSKGEGPGTGARGQQALRRDLGRLMLQMDEFFGDIPSAFGKAERAMNDAVRALRKGRYGDAVPRQSEALDQLRRGMDTMAERMARRMSGTFGVARGRRGQSPGEGNDPFGRRPGGAFGSTIDDGGVKIPSQMERRRAREILHERAPAPGQGTTIHRPPVKAVLEPQWFINWRPERSRSGPWPGAAAGWAGRKARRKKSPRLGPTGQSNRLSRRPTRNPMAGSPPGCLYLETLGLGAIRASGERRPEAASAPWGQAARGRLISISSVKILLRLLL